MLENPMRVQPYSMWFLAPMILNTGCRDQELVEQVNTLKEQVATLQSQNTLRVYVTAKNATGLEFLDDPRVLYLLKRAMTDDKKAYNSILKLRDMGTDIKENHGWVEYWSCENDYCGSHNWTVRVRPEADKMIVCYHDDSFAVEYKVFKRGIDGIYHKPKFSETCPVEWKE